MIIILYNNFIIHKTQFGYAQNMDSVEKIIKIEQLLNSIHIDDIHEFGNGSYYPQILRAIYSVNLKTWDCKNNLNCQKFSCTHECFMETALGSNINAVTRALKLPRETIRRKTNELIDEKLVIRTEKGLFVTQKYRINSYKKSILFNEKLSNLNIK